MRGKNKDLKLTAPQLASKDIWRFFLLPVAPLFWLLQCKQTNKKRKLSRFGSRIFQPWLTQEHLYTSLTYWQQYFFLLSEYSVHSEGNFQGRWGNKMCSHSVTTDTQIMCMNTEHNLGSKGWKGEKCSLTAGGVFESSLGAFCSQQLDSICLLIPIGYVQWWGLNSSSQSHKPVHKLPSGNLSKVRAP